MPLRKNSGLASTRKAQASRASHGPSRSTKRSALDGSTGFKSHSTSPATLFALLHANLSSIWSAINTRRVEHLIKEGLMEEAGLKAFEGRREYRSGIYSYEQRPP